MVTFRGVQSIAIAVGPSSSTPQTFCSSETMSPSNDSCPVFCPSPWHPLLYLLPPLICSKCSREGASCSFVLLCLAYSIPHVSKVRPFGSLHQKSTSFDSCAAFYRALCIPAGGFGEGSKQPCSAAWVPPRPGPCPAPGHRHLCGS